MVGQLALEDPIIDQTEPTSMGQIHSLIAILGGIPFHLNFFILSVFILSVSSEA